MSRDPLFEIDEPVFEVLTDYRADYTGEPLAATFVVDANCALRAEPSDVVKLPQSIAN